MSADRTEDPAEKIVRPIGRPSKYEPEFCEQVVDLGCKGSSRTEIAFELGVGKTTLQRWEAEYPDFRVAMALAKESEQVWWERKGRANLCSQSFQSSMWSRSMAARFPDDWREVSRQERSGPDGKPQEMNHTGSIAVTEIVGRIARLAAREAEAGNPDEPR